jgi:nucleotide-binding universal stress UspA family protein
MYKKILVAVDGSATSLRGLDEAIRLAKSTGGRLLLVHVVNELVVGSDYAAAVNYELVMESLRASGAKVLEEATASVRRSEVPCEQKLIETLGSRVADEIVREARQWPADLIVLGTHGRRGLKRLAMGSDAELVLRLASVPVLMVRDKPESP